MTLVAAALQGVPWYWRWALRVQTRFETFVEQVAATLLALAGFVVLAAVGYALVERLDEDHDRETLEAVLWVVITAAGVAVSAFLVFLWRVTDDVVSSLDFLLLTPETWIKVLLSAVVLLAGHAATRLGKRSVRTGFAAAAVTAHQREVIVHVVQILLFVPAVVFLVALWEVPVRNVFLGAGAVGIIVGFAARKTLSDTLSGIVILLARPFEINDWIRVGDHEGIVTEVTLQNTRIRTFDEEHVLVPNDRITSAEVVNHTRTDRLRLRTDVGVDYDADVARAVAVATEALASCDAVADAPEPDVVRTSFGDSAVVLQLRYWIRDPTIGRKLRARDEVVDAVRAAFAEEGIEIPFPQRELSHRSDAEAVAAVAAVEDAADAGGESSGAEGADDADGESTDR